MEKDMLVKVRYKDAPEDEWFDVLLTEDQKMFDKKTGLEITRTDLLFKADDGSDEIIDMEEEWEKYRREKLREALHDQALYLAKQARSYHEKYKD
jgi:hypothetical protein